MKRIILIACALLQVVGVNAQNNKLSESKRSGGYVYVYRLNASRMHSLFIENKEITEDFLDDFVIRYESQKDWDKVNGAYYSGEYYYPHRLSSVRHIRNDVPELEKGNYILVEAAGNRLVFDSYTVDDLYYDFMEREKLTLALSDAQGLDITGAVVKIGGKTFDFDTSTSLYSIKKPKKETVIEINNKGVYHYLDIADNRPVYRDYYYYGEPVKVKKAKPSKAYTGMVVTNKPKHRPGDTVRMKAYVSDHKGRFADRELELWLSGAVEKRLAVLEPYMPGAYKYEFPLSDTLNLRLDYTYALELRDPKKGDVYVSGYMSYEDYELKKTTFTARTPKQKYREGEDVPITLKVTDENGMAVYDGSAEITIRPNAGQMYVRQAFVPTVLWTKTVSLDGAGQTEVVVPDSVFVKGMSMHCSVTCQYLSSDNEKRTEYLSFYRDLSPYTLDFKITDKGLAVSELHNGDTVRSNAAIVAFSTTGKILESLENVQLPTTIVPKGSVSYYAVKANAADTYYVNAYTASPVVHTFARENGKATLTVLNRFGYPFRYTVWSGGKVVDKGQSTETSLTREYPQDKGYLVRMEYLYGGRMQASESSLRSAGDDIRISVETPLAVYPGQTADIDVSVADGKGLPIKNTDLTALAYTSKFGNGYYPVPYRPVPVHKTATVVVPYSNEKGIYDFRNRMTWERWKKEMELEKIEYYKFLRPGPVYTYSEPARDSVTQIAPYLVVDGDLQGADILWIDELPYYFSGAGSYNVYSFKVEPGEHTVRFRTHDRQVVAKNIRVRAGMKTIVSVDGSETDTDSGVTVTKYRGPDKGDGGRKKQNVRPSEMYGRLTDSELAYLHNFMISVNLNALGTRSLNKQGNNLPNMSYVSAGGNVVILPSFNIYNTGSYGYNNNYYSLGNVLAGPFPFQTYAELTVDRKPEAEFDIEGGYNYTFLPGKLKMKPLGPINRNLRPYVPETDFRSQAVSVEDADSIDRAWKHSMIRNNMNMFVMRGGEVLEPKDYAVDSKSEARLNFQPGNLQDGGSIAPLYIKFRDISDDRTYIFRGVERYFYGMPEGVYDMTLVMGDLSAYTGNVKLRTGGLNYLRLDSIKTESVAAQVEKERHFTETFLFPGNNDRYEYAGNTKARVYTAAQTGDLNRKNLDEYVVTGIVYGPGGTPLHGAVVQRDVKGSKPVVTDEKGRFRMEASGGNFTVTYPGRRPVQVELKAGYHYSVSMWDASVDDTFMMYGSAGRYEAEEEILFDAVAVPSNKTRKSKSLVRMAQEESMDMETAVMGIGDFKRESAEVADDAASDAGAQPGVRPLVILNGLPYSGSLQDIPEESIITKKVLKGEEGIRIYGEQGANGVVIITTAPDGGNLFDNDGMALRRNFRDDAFWQPSLMTDENGKARFTVTYPDDITSWNAKLYAMVKGGTIISDDVAIRAFKALNAQLSLPRFAVEGDRFRAVGKLANYMGDTVNLVRSITTDSGTSEDNITLVTSHTDYIPVTAPAAGDTGGDSLSVRYTIRKADGFFDGEERSIPVYPQGVSETSGVFEVINDNAAHTYAMDADKGVVTVHAEASSLDMFMREIKNVDDYPYMCNEQMASKIIALMLKKRSAGTLGVEFREDRKVRRLIADLNKAKNSDNMWGWWSNDGTSIWISKHVIEAMLMAEAEGYKTDFNKQLAADMLIANLRRYNIYGKNSAYALRDFNRSLVLLKKLGSDVDFSKFTVHTDTITLYSLGDKLNTMRARQAAGAEINIDSLMSWSQSTMMGGLFWGDTWKNAPYWAVRNPYYNNVQHTLCAYEILRDAGGHEKELERIRNYFFEERKGGTWRNTYEASTVMSTIMPDMIKAEDKYSEVSAVINGKPVTQFPYTETTDAKEITVAKSGTLPLFFTAYQKSHNRNPLPVSGDIAVNTVFRENSDTVSVLTAGKSADLLVKVTLKADAEYVMVEVPIPAGCSYDNKWNPWYRNEIHREHYKDRVAIFCPRLTAGEYVFTINLLPRFTGEYRLNPARAELMYFPTFYGRNEMKGIEITPDTLNDR